MAGTIYFHGTKLEQSDLLAALARNCECSQDATTGISTCCPGHTALVSDQHWVDRQEFYRWLRARLSAEEFGGDDAAGGG